MSTLDDPLDLDGVQARVDAATAGPWIIRNGTPNSVWPKSADSWTGKQVARYVSDEDASFISHAREDVPALLARVRALVTARDEAKAKAKVAQADGDLVAELVSHALGTVPPPPGPKPAMKHRGRLDDAELLQLRRLVEQNVPVAAIAKQLGVSAATVRLHAKRIRTSGASHAGQAGPVTAILNTHPSASLTQNSPTTKD